MSLRGLDYAWWRPPSPQWLIDNGYSFVSRYLAYDSPSTHGKILFKPEYDALRAAGVAVVLNWEQGAKDALGGWSTGVAHATEALRQARALGIGGNPAIYFSVDWDVTPAQQATVNSYLQGCAAVVGGAQNVGVYGGYYTVKRALDAGVAAYGWQTFAWSGGQWDTRTAARQTTILTNYDVNTTDSADFGQVGGPGSLHSGGRFGLNLGLLTAPSATQTSAPIPQEDYEMIAVPKSVAFNADGTWSRAEAPLLTVPVPLFAVGSAAGQWGPAWVKLTANGPAKVRVIANGDGYTGRTVDLSLTTGALVPLPAGTDSVFIGRVEGDALTADVNATVRYDVKQAA